MHFMYTNRFYSQDFFGIVVDIDV